MLKLTIELVPSTAWFDNVRSNIDSFAWNKLKKNIAHKAKYRCAICGGHGDKWPVECHEIWQYDDQKYLQKLIGLIALCPACHAVKHLGHTNIIGKADEAINHLATINQWSHDEAVNYVNEQFQIWEERSKHNWELDLSWLKNVR